MTTEELKMYVRIAYELEKQKYTYERIAELYENTMDELQYSAKELHTKELYKGDVNITDNSKTLIAPTDIKNLNYYTYKDLQPIVSQMQYFDYKLYKELIDVLFKKSQTSMRIAGCIALAATIISVLFGIKNGSFFSSLFGGVIIGLIIGVIVLLFFSELTNIDQIKKGSKIYNNIMDAYTKLYNTELGKKQMYLAPKLELLKKEYLEDVVDKMNNTSKLLMKLYNKGIIHKKYQNFVAVSQIYEYLDTGRCTTLEGAHGAYNIFEQELRMNIIINELDMIISQLNSLNTNMSMMVTAINQAQLTLNNISNQLSKVEANSALIAYNTQCISFNTELMRRYN